MTNNLCPPVGVMDEQTPPPQTYLASALSVVVGAEALPDFLTKLGNHVRLEAQNKESLLRSLWDEADRHENICRREYMHRLQEIPDETLLTNKPQLTIFKKSNKSLNIIPGAVRFLTAKAYDEFFGTEPWASFKPQQNADTGEAEAVGRWGRWKLDQEECGFETASRQAIRSAFGNGLTTMKIQHVRLARRHAEFVQALIGEDGMPVMSADGKPVTPDDEVPPQDSGDPTIVPAVSWSTLPDVQMDPSTVQYAPHVVQKEVVTYDGPQAKLLFYRNFLADPKIPKLEDQPFMGDTYEIRAGELKRLYADGLLTPEAFEGAQNASTMDSQDEAKKTRDGEVTSMQHWSSLDINRFIQVVECELDYEVPWSSPDGTGEPTCQLAKLWCVVALNTGQVIWADFLGNITPEGQSHYVNITADSDETRLFGISLPQKYEDASDFIDASFNQLIYRNDFAANPPVCYSPADFAQTKDGKKLEFKPGMQLEKTTHAADKKLDELLETMQLPQMEEMTQYGIDTMSKVVQTDCGVTGAAQGDVGALPATTTATGVRSILGFGSVLHKLPIRELKGGLERALRKFFDFALFRPASDEFYTYFEGDMQRVEIMTAATRRRLRLDVSLSLSRFADSDKIEAGKNSILLVQDYLNQPPQIQEATRSTYVRVLSDMGLPDAEQLLPPAGMVSMAPPPIPGMPEAGAGPGGPPLSIAGPPGPTSTPNLPGPDPMTQRAA